MPPKPTKEAPEGSALAKPNVIYELAMRRPKGGYAQSGLFELSGVRCPKCGGDVYTRIRFGSHAVLGTVCDACPWRHTFPQPTDSPPGPTQPDLFDAKTNTAAVMREP